MKDYYSTSLSTLRSRAWITIEDVLRTGPVDLISTKAQELYEEGETELFEDERIAQPTIETYDRYGNASYWNIVALRLVGTAPLDETIYCKAYDPDMERFNEYPLKGKIDDTELMDLADLLTQRLLINANV